MSLPLTNTAQGGGRWGLVKTVAAAAVVLGLSKLLAETLPSYHPLLDRATDQPTATIHPHWCHIASSGLPRQLDLGGIFDRDH